MTTRSTMYLLRERVKDFVAGKETPPLTGKSDSSRMLGLIGTFDTPEANAAAAVAGALQMPLVLTSPLVPRLSDYYAGYTLRGFFGEYRQISAALAIARHFGRSRMALIHPKAQQGFADEMDQAAPGYGVTEFYSFSYPLMPTEGNATQVMRQAHANDARIIAIWSEAGNFDVRPLLEGAITLGMLGRNSDYTFLGMGLAGDVLQFRYHERERYFRGFISLGPVAYSSIAWCRFLPRLLKAMFASPDIVWTDPGTGDVASDGGVLNVLYPYIGGAYDTIFIFALALKQLKEAGTPITGPTLFAAMKALQFEGVTNTVSFREDGDRCVRYQLYNYNELTMELDAKGTWDEETDTFRLIPNTSIVWQSGRMEVPPDRPQRKVLMLGSVYTNFTIAMTSILLILSVAFHLLLAISAGGEGLLAAILSHSDLGRVVRRHRLIFESLEKSAPEPCLLFPLFLCLSLDATMGAMLVKSVQPTSSSTLGNRKLGKILLLDALAAGARADSVTRATVRH